MYDGGFGRPKSLRTAAPSGTRLIDSMPHASATSTTPDADHRGREVRRLLRRAALAVDGRRRDLEREPGAQPRGAGDVERLLADLAHAAADDLADLERVDAGPLDRGPLHEAEQVGGVHGGERAVAAPERRAHGLDDDDVVVAEFGHGCSSDGSEPESGES